MCYNSKKNNKKAEEIIKEAIKIQNTLKDKKTLAELYLKLAGFYLGQNKYVQAVKQYNYVLQIYKDAKLERKQGITLINLGHLYYKLKNYDVALNYLEKAIQINKTLKNENQIAYINIEIGYIYFEKQDYKKSIELVEKALKKRLAANDLLNSADCYFLLAKTHQKINKKDKALIYINKCLLLYQKLGDIPSIVISKTFLAELYLDTDANKATQIAEEALAMLDSDSTNDSKANLYNLLYKCYKKTNKTDLSHKMYEKYLVYNDSVVKEQSNLALMKEAVNQEFKIELSKTKQSFQKSEQDLKRNQFIKLAVVILIALSIVFLIYYFSKKRIIANNKEKQALVEEIKELKKSYMLSSNNATETTENFTLNRTNIETAAKRKLNETDWAVLNVLLENPVSSNKEIAAKTFMSVDGIGSSLRRMYEYFEIGDSKYKKTDLIRKAIQVSTHSI